MNGFRRRSNLHPTATRPHRGRQFILPSPLDVRGVAGQVDEDALDVAVEEGEAAVIRDPPDRLRVRLDQPGEAHDEDHDQRHECQYQLDPSVHASGRPGRSC